MGRLEELTNSQRNALAAMGVQLYYQRSSTSAGVEPREKVRSSAAGPAVQPVPAARPVPTAEPVPTAQPTVAPIRFDWVRGGGLLWIDQLGDDQQAFVQDVVRFLDWRFAHATPRLAAGTFQWPQLSATDGSPRRPLAAFFTKQRGDPSSGQPPPAWMLVDRYVADEVLCHLDDLGDLRCFVVEQFAQAISDPSLKRALWQTITK